MRRLALPAASRVRLQLEGCEEQIAVRQPMPVDPVVDLVASLLDELQHDADPYRFGQTSSRKAILEVFFDSAATSGIAVGERVLSKLGIVALLFYTSMVPR